ncbi:MAG: hypothetical protein H8D38_05790 [DPANN group archaeon]|nr:hypothetical protein [DPANN group archaeon]
MKRLLLFCLVLLIIPFASAELAYKFDFEEKDGELVVNFVNLVNVEDYEIVRPVIGKYLLVAGNGTSDYEYLDGVFFTLPAVTFVAYLDEDGEFADYTEEKNSTVVYLPYNEEVKEFKVFIDNGTEVLSFPAPGQEAVKTLSEEMVEETVAKELQDDEETAGKLDVSPSYKRKPWPIVTIIIAVLIIIAVYLLKKKFEQKDNEEN